MFIRNSKRFNIYSQATIDGITYPNFLSAPLRTQLGITEIPDPAPPEGYIEDEWYRTEQDDAPYVVYTQKSAEQIAAIHAAKLASNQATLWNAANEYNTQGISGSGVGLLTIGVIQQKPKSAAVMAWIQSIWNLYYTRKAQLTYELIPEGFLDFSECGAMPCTVPELMAEILL